MRYLGLPKVLIPPPTLQLSIPTRRLVVSLTPPDGADEVQDEGVLKEHLSPGEAISTSNWSSPVRRWLLTPEWDTGAVCPVSSAEMGIPERDEDRSTECRREARSV
jgi:hypothetical protein